ncbi:glycosyl transferase, family 2 [Pseudogulbenkiania sp. NH8B]|nr:glycosyl transferase, family 2 [Pseudogulbenkiania sp. NH8B]
MPKVAKRLDYNYEMTWFNYDKIVEIPCASGCFMALRTESFRKLNGFDEQFFMYMEDIDLSRRLAAIGKVIYLPDAVVTHEFAKGSYKSKKLLYAHIRSAIQYFNKWGWVFDKERTRINKDAIAKIMKASE